MLDIREATELAAIVEEWERRQEEARARIEMERVRVQGDAIRAKCRTLHGFIEEFWYVLEPVTPFRTGWALQAMCAHLEAVHRGLFQFLLMTVPPGMMKSLLVSVFFQAWEWGPMGRPDLRYLATSFSDKNVTRDSDKVRRLVMSEKYQALWGDRVQRGVKWGTDLFENTAGGNRDCRPFGSLTGGRGDRNLMDDPHSTTSAESDQQRGETVKQYREGATDRLNDITRSAIIVIMQRLHMNDVAGTIIKLGGFVHLNLPMEFEPDHRCVTPIFTDPRTRAGELLFPERFPQQALAKLKKDKGEYAWCNPPEAPILMADLSFKALGDVKAGDEIIGFTTGTDAASEAVKYSRRTLKGATVTAVHRSVRPIVKMTLESGMVIRCTPDHRWYSGRRDKRLYRAARVGSELLRVCPPSLPELSPTDQRAAGWIAGFFDGEGSVSLVHRRESDRPHALIQFTQGAGRNLPLCDKLESTLTRLGFDFGYKQRPGRAPGANYAVRQYYLRGRSVPLIQRFLHLIEPVKWRDRLIDGARRGRFIIGKERVTSIDPDGEGEVIGLTTTTGNYVVWGLASSNSGQYQQHPVPREGGLFKVHMLKVEAAAPARMIRYVRAWDLAASVQRGSDDPDWTVGVLIARDTQGFFWILDVIRVRYPSEQVEALIKHTADKDSARYGNVKVRGPQDPGQAGKSQAAALTRLLAGHPVEFLPVSGRKEVRATPFAAQVNAGNVRMLEGPWNDAFTEELGLFPGATHDDQVDAGSDAFNDVAANGGADGWLQSYRERYEARHRDEFDDEGELAHA